MYNKIILKEITKNPLTGAFANEICNTINTITELSIKYKHETIVKIRNNSRYSCANIGTRLHPVIN